MGGRRLERGRRRRPIPVQVGSTILQAVVTVTGTVTARGDRYRDRYIQYVTQLGWGIWAAAGSSGGGGGVRFLSKLEALFLQAVVTVMGTVITRRDRYGDRCIRYVTQLGGRN